MRHEIGVEKTEVSEVSDKIKTRKNWKSNLVVIWQKRNAGELRIKVGKQVQGVTWLLPRSRGTMNERAVRRARIMTWHNFGNTGFHSTWVEPQAVHFHGSSMVSCHGGPDALYRNGCYGSHNSQRLCYLCSTNSLVLQQLHAWGGEHCAKVRLFFAKSLSVLHHLHLIRTV